MKLAGYHDTPVYYVSQVILTRSVITRKINEQVSRQIPERQRQAGRGRESVKREGGERGERGERRGRDRERERKRERARERERERET